VFCIMSQFISIQWQCPLQAQCPEDTYSMGGTAPYINLGTGLRVGRSGIRIPEGQEMYLLTRTSRRALGSIQPRIQLLPEIFHGAKAARK